MRKNSWKFILSTLIFIRTFFIRKFLIFFFLLEFDLYIDFQSPAMVHTQIGSTFDCMIFVNDDCTLLHDFLLHSTLRKSIAHILFL